VQSRALPQWPAGLRSGYGIFRDSLTLTNGDAALTGMEVAGAAAGLGGAGYALGQLVKAGKELGLAHKVNGDWLTGSFERV
jgi:hypothetical protein